MVHGDPAKASPAQAGLQQGTLKSSCVAIQKKTADPQMVLLGETVDVTLTVTALCAGESFPLHIVLVLDSSGSARDRPRDARSGAGSRVGSPSV